MVLKPYAQHQLSLLQLSMEKLTPTNHLVRLVDAAIEKMNLEVLLRQYQGGGASRFHPKMMIKVFVYAYS